MEVDLHQMAIFTNNFMQYFRLPAYCSCKACTCALNELFSAERVDEVVEDIKLNSFPIIEVTKGWGRGAVVWDGGVWQFQQFL